MNRRPNQNQPGARRARAISRIQLWLGTYGGAALVVIGLTHAGNSRRWLADLYAADKSDAIETAAELAHVMRVAEGLEGRPYLYGGADEDGFDFSGFTYYVYGRAGYRIPRTVQEQFHGLVSIRDPRPGDLVFFAVDSDVVTHVGIYAGQGHFIHAPSSGGHVRIESMQTPYWQQRLRGSRTVIVPDLAESDFGDE